MKSVKENLTAVHELISRAANSSSTPIEAMQLTQAALNAANALASTDRLKEGERG